MDFKSYVSAIIVDKKTFALQLLKLLAAYFLLTPYAGNSRRYFGYRR
jgi:hypothetical protein